MADLDRLAGEWTQEVLVEGVPPGRMVFQWAFNDRYLVQSIEIPKPEFPDSLAIIAPNPDGTDGGEHWEVDFPVRLTRAAAPSP